MKSEDAWFFLSIAIIFGVLGTISLKLSHNMRSLFQGILILIFYSISFIALTFAMQTLDLSLVYAVWSGVGTVLVATIGILYFKESVSIKKIIFLMLVVIGVIGIHISDSLTKL